MSNYTYYTFRNMTLTLFLIYLQCYTKLQSVKLAYIRVRITALAYNFTGAFD